ncbi:protein of unknown function [Arthrobacter sp. yr096]|uniref:3'-5' exoribonuclease domain-containing protein n=1 Tax=Arthrobacter sp. yr096 TaxID=1761750 RepID=UPI0008BCA7F4|nr:3'-5' exoribonuclease [Arthrobacter sp. yr096]SEI45112.1 protein of unknown function [Arthrobacter sp. yr096]
MKYFYDTEFLEDGHTIDLISIGIVAEDGREYYAVNMEADWDRIQQHGWLRENVLPHLYAHGPREQVWQTREQIRTGVHRFLTKTPDTQLWAWFGAYDHVVLAQLFGPMIQLPHGIPMYTNDVRSLVDFTGITELPKQGGTAHDALEDARHVKVMHDYIGRALFAREHVGVVSIRAAVGVEKP